MRNRRTALDHSEAVARRLALLNAELGVQVPQGEDAVAWAGPTRISGTPWPEDEFEFGGEDESGQAHDEAVADGAEAEWPDEETGPRQGVREVRGRHAARPGAGRLGTGVARLVTVAGPGSRAPGQVAVILAGLVLALAVTCGWLLLADSNEGLVAVEPLSARPSVGAEGAGAGNDDKVASGPAATPASSSEASGRSRPAASSSGDVVVHVAGKVKRPGIVVLPAGSRVADALDRAGGARRGVDTSSLNLARVLVDGEQVLVGEKPAAGVPGVPAAAGSVTAPAPAASGKALVNVNTAAQAELETLPGVGPVMANAIIEWRTTHGGFASVGDLLEVKGIGDATLSRLTPLVTL